MRRLTYILAAASLLSFTLVAGNAGCRSTAPIEIDSAEVLASSVTDQPSLGSPLTYQSEEASDNHAAILDPSAFSRPLTSGTDLPEQQWELSLGHRSPGAAVGA